MVFVNADLIAQELSGVAGTSADINAGRLLLERVENLEAHHKDFAFETTLATRMLSKRVSHWRQIGYQVHLIYFYLPDEGLCVLRVQGRVQDGGHNVPEETIRRRYSAGIRLFFNSYRHLVDTWRMYDNSSDKEPRLIARGDSEGNIKVLLPEIWNELMEKYGR